MHATGWAMRPSPDRRGPPQPRTPQATTATHAAEHYKIFGQMQHKKSVAKDPKMVAIVLLLPFFG
jgi:hypothetical protein